MIQMYYIHKKNVLAHNALSSLSVSSCYWSSPLFIMSLNYSSLSTQLFRFWDTILLLLSYVGGIIFEYIFSFSDDDFYLLLNSFEDEYKTTSNDIFQVLPKNSSNNQSPNDNEDKIGKIEVAKALQDFAFPSLEMIKSREKKEQAKLHSFIFPKKDNSDDNLYQSN